MDEDLLAGIKISYTNMLYCSTQTFTTALLGTNTWH